MCQDVDGDATNRRLARVLHAVRGAVLPHIVADQLRALREARGWDQRLLALAAGIDPSVVSRLERGLQNDLKASVLIAIARALRVSVDVLLRDPTPTPDLVHYRARLCSAGVLALFRTRAPSCCPARAAPS